MDRDLRALERAAREDPDDLALGWAHASALERAGKTSARFRELRRLARAGSPDARAALASSPFSLTAPSRGRRPAPRSPTHRSARFEVPPGLRPVAATPQGLVALGGGRLALIDLEALELRWSIESRAQHATLVGRDVLVAERDTLALRSGASGSPLARANVLGHTSALLVTGDRIVLASSVEGAPHVSVLGTERLDPSWERPIPHARLVLASYDRVYTIHEDHPGIAVRSFHLEDGEPSAQAFVIRRATSWSLAVDEHGLAWRSTLEGGDVYAGELEESALETRWRRTFATPVHLDEKPRPPGEDGSLALADGFALLEGPERRLFVVERSSGEPRLELALGRRHAGALASDVFYLVQATHDLTVEAYELGGTRVFAHTTLSPRGVTRALVIPQERAAVTVGWGEGEVVLLRSFET